jgi:steroid 5-alpha reductase family enzyme
VGIALLGLAAGEWWAHLSPLLVFIIITRITGVAAMDRHLRDTRGEVYARYVRTTSAFVPLPKRAPR